jgi:hypothetical protein
LGDGGGGSSLGFRRRDGFFFQKYLSKTPWQIVIRLDLFPVKRIFKYGREEKAAAAGNQRTAGSYCNGDCGLFGPIAAFAVLRRLGSKIFPGERYGFSR